VFSVHTIELYLLYRTYPEVISANQNAVGSYDHSQEYDPYQSAARQMQELLFGSSTGASKSDTAGNSSNKASSKESAPVVRPSTNSAFEKYVPSTSDINDKLNAKSR
jgi:hypothetical protein